MPQRIPVIALHPKWATLILSGQKSKELRRRFPQFPQPRRALIYESSPVKAITGECIIERVELMHPSEILTRYPTESCVSPELIAEYYDGRDQAAVLHVARAFRYYRPLSLAMLRAEHSFTAPQSFCYAPESLMKLIAR